MNGSYRFKVAYTCIDKTYDFRVDTIAGDFFRDITPRIRQDFNFHTDDDFELVDYRNTETGLAVKLNPNEQNTKIILLYSNETVFYIRPKVIISELTCVICDTSPHLQIFYQCTHQICASCYANSQAHDMFNCAFCRAPNL